MPGFRTPWPRRGSVLRCYCTTSWRDVLATLRPSPERGRERFCPGFLDATRRAESIFTVTYARRAGAPLDTPQRCVLRELGSQATQRSFPVSFALQDAVALAGEFALAMCQSRQGLRTASNAPVRVRHNCIVLIGGRGCGSHFNMAKVGWWDIPSNVNGIL